MCLSSSFSINHFILLLQDTRRIRRRRRKGDIFHNSRLKMVKFQFIGIFLALFMSQTMAGDSNFIICPKFCTCKSKTINCPIESLPVNTPPGPFNLLRITNSQNRAAVIPARAFRFLGDNTQLNIRFTMANITKISAHAFDGIKGIRQIYFSHCNIGEIERNSFSNISVYSIYSFNTSIGTIRPLAFNNMNLSSSIIFFKSNVTRILRAAFNRVQIKYILFYKSNIKLIESNGFGLWNDGIDSLRLKQCNLGSFKCNEPTNGTSLVVAKTTMNCSCSTIWMLRNTSNFYPLISEFVCQGEAAGVSLAEREDTLLAYCSNRTETIDDMCSQRQNYEEEVNIGPIKGDSVRHVTTASLFLFSLLILLERNFFFQ